MKQWHDTYRDRGLVVVGVHTPEFPHEAKASNVRKAVRELGITFPVGIDNEYAVWKRYENQAWPTIYLVDTEGQIVYVHVGEGEYQKTEARIRQLLSRVRI